MRVKVPTEKGLKDLEDTPLKLDGSEPMRTPHRHRAVHQDLIMSPKPDTPKIETSIFLARLQRKFAGAGGVVVCGT